MAKIDVVKAKALDPIGSAGMDDHCRPPVEASDVEPRLLTLGAVAMYMSVGEGLVYALVQSGELPAVKIGGRGVWRVDRKVLDAYIDNL
jgi:excisionase family DNA binding protein